MNSSASLKPLRFATAVILTLGAAAALPPLVAQAAPASDNASARARQDTGHALVQLVGDPVTTAAKTRPAQGKKIDFDSSSVKAYRAQLAALRNDYKRWLRANVPQASVTGEFDIALNAVSVRLGGATLAQVAATPLVQSAQYEGVYYPNAVDPDLALIDARAAWMQGGRTAADAGRGVKVAIIDSGIDHLHPCFSDNGYPGQRQLGDPNLTNNKVIAARVFNNQLPRNGLSAAAIDSHGTHVAGTVACNADTAATVNGVTIPYGISGVAPAALLGNYNVFPGTVGNARSEDILNALEAAYADGMDVANMSLGGGASGIQDLLTIAVDNLDRANMVIAVAAGNSGPGFGTVESPGSAARALTAGASTVPHFVGAPVTTGAGAVGAASGDFAIVDANLTAPLGVVTGSTNGLDTACAALPTGSLSGKIALISRGTCTFSTKIRNAQAAGALAVLVANNVAGDPTAMGSDGTANQPVVPAYMVGLQEGQGLKGQNATSTTISAVLTYIVTTNANIMAGFSSQGATDVDFRVKPDVVAPGVNVLSSIPRSHCNGAPSCFAFFSGTSMATPHLAGSAAVVLSQHADWTAEQVRSAVVNTARPGVLTDFATGTNVVTSANIVGTGIGNLLAAVNASVALDPVSISYGRVPSGSGLKRQAVLTITNIGSAARTIDLAVSGAPSGIAVTLDRSTLALGVGESAQVTVTMSAGKGIAAGNKQATLTVREGNTTIGRAVLFALVNP